MKFIEGVGGTTGNSLLDFGGHDHDADAGILKRNFTTGEKLCEFC